MIAKGTRRRIKHVKTFEERLAEEALQFREAAQKQPPGSHARELLLRRARQAEAASSMNDWLSSPVLQPPKRFEELAVRSEQISRSIQMQDYLAMERLRKDAAEAELIRDLATEKSKRDFFDRLQRHVNRLADEIEEAVNRAKMAQGGSWLVAFAPGSNGRNQRMHRRRRFTQISEWLGFAGRASQ